MSAEILAILFRQPSVNPLRAKVFIRGIKIYVQFISLLHTDMTQVVEIPPRVRQELIYSQSISWVLKSW